MLHHLDDDLLHHCLGLLAPQDLSRCAAITRRLLRLASDESLWRPHFDALLSAGTAVALTVPTRLAFAAVSLISAARLNAASAERLRTREKHLYNRSRFLAQQVRQALRRVEDSKQAQQAAESARQRLLAQQALALMEHQEAKRPGGWALKRPRTPPADAAAEATVEQCIRAAATLRAAEVMASQTKLALNESNAEGRETQRERRRAEAAAEAARRVLGPALPWHATLEPMLPPNTGPSANPPPQSSLFGTCEERTD